MRGVLAAEIFKMARIHHPGHWEIAGCRVAILTGGYFPDPNPAFPDEFELLKIVEKAGLPGNIGQQARFWKLSSLKNLG